MYPDYNKAVQAAIQLLNNNPEYTMARPVNFMAILNDLGLKPIIVEDIEDEALLDPQRKEIQIKDDNLPVSRKFFSIAHEIGHWILHSRDKKRERSGNYNTLSQDRIIEEQEANAFAAELLMPYDEVANCILYGCTIQDLANYFNVSYEFASYRYNFVISGIM